MKLISITTTAVIEPDEIEAEVLHRRMNTGTVSGAPSIDMLEHAAGKHDVERTDRRDDGDQAQVEALHDLLRVAEQRH